MQRRGQGPTTLQGREEPCRPRTQAGSRKDLLPRCLLSSLPLGMYTAAIFTHGLPEGTHGFRAGSSTIKDQLRLP